MRTLKFIFPMMALVISCNWKRANHNEPKIEKVTIEPDSQISLQNQFDSNYFENMKRIAENPYSSFYDTSLNGGFSISFCNDKEMQYLLYKKGDTLKDTIGSTSLGIRYKSLGYIGADFDKTFVFVNSFGNGNPHYIRLYEKETLTNLIPDGSAWIDVDTSSQVLLFSKSDVPFEGDSMTLFDTKKMSYKNYAFPKEIFDGPQKLKRIKLIKLNERAFTIEFECEEGIKIKKYSR